MVLYIYLICQEKSTKCRYINHISSAKEQLPRHPGPPAEKVLRPPNTYPNKNLGRLDVQGLFKIPSSKSSWFDNMHLKLLMEKLRLTTWDVCITPYKSWDKRDKLPTSTGFLAGFLNHQQKGHQKLQGDERPRPWQLAARLR